MDNSNNIPQETGSAPAAVAAPVASAPEAAPVPAVTAAPVVTAAPAVTAAPKPTAPVEIFKGPIQQTSGTTPGGWNRFAGYNPHEAKNKKNDRRGDSKGRR